MRGVVRIARERGAFRLFRGSVLLSLVPVYALALILISLTVRPYLRHEERRWLAQDKVIALDPSGGFTRVEAAVTQRLKAEITAAAAGLKP